MRSTSAEAGEPRYSFAAVDHLVRLLSTHDAAWQRFFAQAGGSVLTLTYEEVAADLAGTLQRTLDHIGVTPPEDALGALPTMRRQADERSDAWAEALRRPHMIGRVAYEEGVLQALQRVTDAALAHLSEDDLLTELLSRITEILDADTAAFLLLDPETATSSTRAPRAGIEEEVEQDVHIPVGRGFAGRIAAERRPVRSRTSTTPTSSTRSCARRASARCSACRC